MKVPTQRLEIPGPCWKSSEEGPTREAAELEENGVVRNGMPWRGVVVVSWVWDSGWVPRGDLGLGSAEGHRNLPDPHSSDFPEQDGSGSRFVRMVGIGCPEPT